MQLINLEIPRIFAISYFVDSLKNDLIRKECPLLYLTTSITSNTVLHATIPSSFASNFNDVMDGILFSSTLLL